MMRAANFLPWVAALSFGAFVAVLPALYFGARFALVFPVALGVCSVPGIPTALLYRGKARWLILLGIVLGLGLLIALIWAIASLSNVRGEAAGWVFGITISLIVYGLAMLPIVLVIAMAILVVASITALMVLFLSGEVAALRRGMSIYNLPYPRLRASLLLLLATAPPLAAYGAQYTPSIDKSYGESFGKDCQYVHASRLMHQNDVYIDVDEPDWPQLKQVVEKFAASHAMRMVPGDPRSSARGDPLEYGVCMPGRFVFSFTKTPDVPNSGFEPKGDRYVTLTSFVARGQRSEYTLRALAAAIDSQWPGIKLGSDVDLGPSLNWRKVDSNACRTKVAKVEYKFCLGGLSDVRKETLYVHGPTDDWSRLQSLMAEFAASHGMAFNTAETNSAFPWIDLCTAGRVQINSTVNVRDVPLVRGEHFHVRIVTYIPPTNPDATATVDQLLAALDAEWPGVMRSRPEPDFCRALKAQK